MCCQTSRGRSRRVGNWLALALNSKGEGWMGSRREINELAEAKTNYRVEQFLKRRRRRYISNLYFYIIIFYTQSGHSGEQWSQAMFRFRGWKRTSLSRISMNFMGHSCEIETRFFSVAQLLKLEYSRRASLFRQSWLLCAKSFVGGALDIEINDAIRSWKIFRWVLIYMFCIMGRWMNILNKYRI